MFRIVRADPRDVEIAMAPMGAIIFMPALAVLGVDGDRVVGSGGLAWGGGRCWIWFGMLESKPRYALPIYRETLRMLKRAVQLGENAVWTVRDDRQPMSRKLLGMLGFELSGMEAAGDREVEVWRVSLHG